MDKSYYDTMSSINTEIDFFKHERNLAFDKMDEINQSKTLPMEVKKEICLEWQKIAIKLDDMLNELLILKKEINTSYQRKDI